MHSSSFNVVFISLHFPFMFIPMCIHVLSFSFHLHAFSFHFAFMSFHLLSEVMEMVLLLGQGTECNKWLSLNNLSKSPPTYDIVRQIFSRKRQTERQRERERKKRARKRERESKRVGCRMMVTAGNRAPQVEFPSSVLPVL